MEFLISCFETPELLDEEKFKGVKFEFPQSYLFAKQVDAVPLGLSEIIACTMYYPVFFAQHQGEVVPFAVLGINKQNVFVKEDGGWKTEIIPSLIRIYPFGFVKEGEDYLVIIDKKWISEDGVELFTELGEETKFFKEKRQELTRVAKDLNDALEFGKKIMELGLLTNIDLQADTALGKLRIKNLLSVDIARFKSLSPEKLWYLNTSGQLLTLLSHYLSLRNFKLLELWAQRP